MYTFPGGHLPSRPEAEHMKKLLTVAEAAETLNLKVSTIRAWLLRRRLPRVSLGRSVRIPADSIAQFIEKHTVPAREERR
jgi:excisionase family DNA binding protein